MTFANKNMFILIYIIAAQKIIKIKKYLTFFKYINILCIILNLHLINLVIFLEYIVFDHEIFK